MKSFTHSRSGDTQDECWIVEHDPVFTLGQATKKEHLLAIKDIPVIQSDRGGQVTYHGPGQVVLYFLVDIKRNGLGVRDFVSLLENTVISTLKDLGVNAHTKPKAPGVYVDGRKIASIGLRVRKGSTYHGLSFNLDMDLSPFSQINPCGYPGLELVNLTELLPGKRFTFEQIADQLLEQFCALSKFEKRIAEKKPA